jgi:CHASE3 domain sensor protein
VNTLEEAFLGALSTSLRELALAGNALGDAMAARHSPFAALTAVCIVIVIVIVIIIVVVVIGCIVLN